MISVSWSHIVYWRNGGGSIQVSASELRRIITPEKWLIINRWECVGGSKITRKSPVWCVWRKKPGRAPRLKKISVERRRLRKYSCTCALKTWENPKIWDCAGGREKTCLVPVVSFSLHFRVYVREARYKKCLVVAHEEVNWGYYGTTSQVIWRNKLDWKRNNKTKSNSWYLKGEWSGFSWITHMATGVRVIHVIMPRSWGWGAG